MACRLGQKNHTNPYYGYKQIKGRLKIGDAAVVKDVKAINAMIDSAAPVPSYKSVRIGDADVIVEYEQCGKEITILNFQCDNYVSLLTNILGNADRVTNKLKDKIRNP